MNLLINLTLKTVKGQFCSRNLHSQRVTEYHVGDIVMYLPSILRSLLFRQTNTHYINNKILYRKVLYDEDFIFNMLYSCWSK